MLSRRLAAAFAAALVASPVVAQEAAPSCAGRDLISKAKAEDPKAYAAFETEARAVPNAEGLLWRITPKAANVAPSYLFGTMHTTDADLVALSEPVRAALKDARTVAVEIADANGAAAQAEVVAYVTRNAIDLSGKGLEGLDEAQRKEVGRRIAENGLPASVASSLKPWFLGITLQVSACETRRMAEGLPTIDFAVERIGRENGAKIVGLESVTEQLDAVSKVPDETARRMIRDTVATPEAGGDLQTTTLALYRARKVGWYLAMKGGLFGAGFDVEAYADFMSELVDRRNTLMSERSKALIDEGGAFVAVGALHLPGQKGLVELYRRAGYVVEKAW
ncbi:uncharacterized protein YbaP (TraB family) [Methylopila capsulata]|uniref:Uncharacterized protein YbaP (TraB family) n=1 Tax=Methylopila capsulata TaxID=61654 RepID=A0A9W6IRR4_9HYPH|nr:TraB/GumN family protein [Methylopila capsulata]MBM7851918.1 uncharacterized protein YbaP (TraB family) [Methylopila capsulata]GLK54983.1 hypothetical protein GCM10008170_10020 [Methylopila capsulata]